VVFRASGFVDSRVWVCEYEFAFALYLYLPNRVKHHCVQVVNNHWHCHLLLEAIEKGQESLPLDELLESAVDGGAYFGALVEVDGGNSALGDALGGEFEFLWHWSVWSRLKY